MIPTVPRLLLIRAFQNWEGRCGLYHLFSDGNEREGIIISNSSTRPISWTYPQEFISVAHREPVEFVHARSQAFGGSDIQLDDERALEFPARYLVTPEPMPAAALYQRGGIQAEWLLTGVFEVPAFCINLPLLEQARAELGFTADGFDIAKAAQTLKPMPLDVIGSFTADGALCGALEFASHVEGNVYLAHFIGISQSDRKLQPGDLLHGRYEARIGETHLTAERPLVRVLDVGSPEVPPLGIPKNS